jgi:hypothetical protein
MRLQSHQVARRRLHRGCTGYQCSPGQADTKANQVTISAVTKPSAVMHAVICGVVLAALTAAERRC